MDKQFAFAIVVIVLFGTLGAKVCLINRKNIFISEVMIGRPLGVVWTFLSEPGKYARLYPNWIKTIELVGGDTYKVEDRFGGSNSIAVIRNKEFGVIDLPAPSLDILGLSKRNLSHWDLKCFELVQGIGSPSWSFSMKDNIPKMFCNRKGVVLPLCKS